jgi:multiple sugar transport system substrate-binding protein
MRRFLLKSLIAAIIIMFIASFSIVSCKAEEPAEEVTEEVTEEVAEEVVEEEPAEEAVEEAAEEELSGTVVYINMWTGGNWRDVTYDIADAFMAKYPNVELKIIDTDMATWPTMLQAAMSSSEPPDASQFWGAGMLKDNIVDAGLVVPINDIIDGIDGFTENVKASNLGMVKYEDTGDDIWAMPFTSFFAGFYYNMHVWEAAGFEKDYKPRTWEEFIELCDKIQATGTPPLIFETGQSSNRMLDAMIRRTTDDPAYAAQLFSGKAGLSFDDERFKLADNYWDEMQPYMHPDTATMDYPSFYQNIATGDAGMGYMGTWLTSSLEDELELEYGTDFGFFRFPQIDPDIELYENFINCNTVILTTQGADNPAAKAWVAFWGTPEAQTIVAERGNATVALNNVEYSSPALADVQAEILGDMGMMEFDGHTPGSLLPDVVVITTSRMSGLITQEEEIEQLNKLYSDWAAENQ